MYTLLVLGLVPGTNFQITFEFWLQCLEALAAASLLTNLGMRYVKVGRKGLLESADLRAILPATRLHR
ncbi:MAG: hypothetical protein QFB87_01665 [Patescibacteria group bacterium]|nr:hypothetical protein [Patescibacteria group bacterium]